MRTIRARDVAKVSTLSESEATMEKPMEQQNHADAEKSDLKEKLDSLVEKAKEVCERLQEQTAAAAKTTDKTIHEHPYHAAGIAFGVGLLIGVLVARRRCN